MGLKDRCPHTFGHRVSLVCDSRGRISVCYEGFMEKASWRQACIFHQARYGVQVQYKEVSF